MAEAVRTGRFYNYLRINGISAACFQIQSNNNKIIYMEATIIWVVAAAVIALIAGYMVAASRSKSNARSQANIIIDEAKREG